MKESIISRNDSNLMKGIAIFFIVVHNLVHLLVPLKESEFAFFPHLYGMFKDSLWTIQDSLWADVFSFLGWYGVPIFLFLSGYGLVKKYESGGNEVGITFKQFMIYHWKKLFLLMIIPYLFFLFFDYLLMGGGVVFPMMIKQLLLVSNFWTEEIQPGIYWYFGLMLQMYTCYYLFFYKKDIKNIIILNLMSFILIGFCVYYNRPSVVPLFTFIRHQFIGWILPFTFGILYARYDWRIVFKVYWKNLLMFILGSILLVYSNSNGYLWIFSPIIAICIALYLCELMKKIRYTSKFFVFLGQISAFMFAVSPVIRHLYWYYKTGDMLLDTTVYVLVSILFSIIYKWIHKNLFAKF
jgi:peptidoglycan/LPS O-acetylase OafA/YrhL